MSPPDGWIQNKGAPDRDARSGTIQLAKLHSGRSFVEENKELPPRRHESVGSIGRVILKRIANHSNDAIGSAAKFGCKVAHFRRLLRRTGGILPYEPAIYVAGPRFFAGESDVHKCDTIGSACSIRSGTTKPLSSSDLPYLARKIGLWR